jgi:Ca-activated chloride channel homolog
MEIHKWRLAIMSRIQLETSLLRDFIFVTSENFSNYLLVKAMPADRDVQTMAVNASLVIDVSGSMYSEERLENVKKAAEHAIGMMSPDDIVSVVAFATHSQVVCPTTNVGDRDPIIHAIRNIEDVDVGGGTSMNRGMEKGVDEVRKNMVAGRLNRVIVLTDGQTTGADECKSIARREEASGMTFSALGVGSSWNEELLKDIAGSQGNWYYIDKPDAAQGIFSQEFGQLTATAFDDVVMKFHLMQNIAVKRGRQVQPDFAELPVNIVDERTATVDIGVMQKDAPKWVVLDMSLPTRPLGRYRIAQVELTYSIPALGIPTESSELAPVFVVYTADRTQSVVNPEVAKCIDGLQIEELTSRATQLIAQGDQSRATMLLTNAQNIAQKTGDSRKTAVLGEALSEMGTGGEISRKTMISVKDQARKTGVLSEEEVAELLKQAGTQ